MTTPTPGVSGTFQTKAEADAWVAAYNRDRCECGGSPAWVDPDQQVHVWDCPVREALAREERQA